MRIVSGIFCVLLILFVVVQYNDPDGPLWAVIYGVGALWCGAVALRPLAVRRSPNSLALGATLVAAIGGMAWYWPDTPHWWWQEVWWETETAREGMGMMIVVVALLLAGLTALRARPA